MNNNIRLALVGAGRWGRNYIQTIDNLDGVTLTHLASSNPDSTGLVNPNCMVVPNWRPMIEKGGFEGLIIATPPATHAEIALAAIEIKLPVIIEKPLTLDACEAAILTEAAEKHDAQVLVDHIHLYNPAFRVLKTMVAGWNRIDKIESRSEKWGPFRNDAPVLWDWGAHDIAMLLDIIGDLPENVSAKQIGSYAVEGGQAESIAIDLKWKTGLTAKAEINNHWSEKVKRFEVYSDAEVLVYDDVAVQKLIRSIDGGKNFNPIKVPSDPPLTVILREFAQAIRDNVKDISGLLLGKRVVSVLSECQAALKERLV